MFPIPHLSRVCDHDLFDGESSFTFIADYIIKRELQKKEIMTSKVISFYFAEVRWGVIARWALFTPALTFSVESLRTKNPLFEPVRRKET